MAVKIEVKSPAESYYESSRQLYIALVEEVKFSIDKISTEENLKYANLIGRVKTVNSFKEKVERKGLDIHQIDFNEIRDLAGVRVVCLFSQEIELFNNLIRETFEVVNVEDKKEGLGSNKMGYMGNHFEIKLGAKFKGARYDQISELICEIQVRTALQDAWALMSHNLVYKSEKTTPEEIQRQINNVASLLEVSQNTFDQVSLKRNEYIDKIKPKNKKDLDILKQPINYDSLQVYTIWKYPKSHGVNAVIQMTLLNQLNESKYKTIEDIDQAVQKSKKFLEEYSKEKPDWFKFGTDYITKSLGFTDLEFRQIHGFAPYTRAAFERYKDLLLQ